MEIYYYIFGVLLTAIILGCCIFLVIRSKKKTEVKEQANLYVEFLKLLGGQDNIVEVEAKGSRLNLVLKDYSLMDEKKLKELGVSSIIKMTKKVTLVIGNMAEELACKLKGK